MRDGHVGQGAEVGLPLPGRGRDAVPSRFRSPVGSMSVPEQDLEGSRSPRERLSWTSGSEAESGAVG